MIFVDFLFVEAKLPRSKEKDMSEIKVKRSPQLHGIQNVLIHGMNSGAIHHLVQNPVLVGSFHRFASY